MTAASFPVRSSREGLSSTTRLLCGCFRVHSVTSSQIVSVGDWLEMLWVSVSSVSAEMVTLLSLWERSLPLFTHDPMPHHGFSVDGCFPVAMTCFCSCPDPTSTWGICSRGTEALHQCWFIPHRF